MRTLAHTHIYSLLASSREPFSNTSRKRFLMTRIFLSREEWESHQQGTELGIRGGASGSSKEELEAPSQALH